MENDLSQKTVASELAQIQERIARACAAAGRNPQEVEVIGVTKTFGPEVVAEAWEAGIRRFGENRVQEATFKIPQCIAGPEWHLVGHLQRNKIRPALAFFTTLHSVDSLRLLDQIEAAAQDAGVRPNILLQVNVSGESSKFGLTPEETPRAVERALECRALTLIGLMTLAPFCPDPEQTRPVFARLRDLRDRLSHDFDIGLPHLSMGMSNDFEAAVREGATWIRIGTLLFGHRPTLKQTLRAQMVADGGWEE